ncbi:MAG: hypothetical protein FJZ13_05650 [Candidatus Omnitrophica bacterium]|nr:hypothetical protein [Candidatus Omnitrophota bacterium]
MLNFKAVKIKKPDEVNFILGQSHFIKTVEDLGEALVSSVPGIKFGLAFVESSGACKIRSEGNDAELKKLAEDNALEIAAGHSFIVFMKDAYPINVLNAIKNIPEVCAIYCASANPAQVVIAEVENEGRAILGVVDGVKPKGIESDEDIAWRKGFLRQLGYKF